MRGAPNSLIQERSIGGIILADAGSTPGTSRLVPARKDHPRGCGEHEAASSDMSREWGSSSRMRGAPSVVSFGFDQCGIILADAGSTDSFRRL